MIEISEVDKVSEATAHTILNYCLTQAVLKNKNHKFTVQIPYSVLAKSCGKSEEDIVKYPDVALHLTVDMNWGEHDSDEVELEIG